MAQPITPLLVAPSDNADDLGQSIMSDDLVKGLKIVNPKIRIPLPEHYDGWYPGKALGMTAIWMGEPSKPTSKKICAFHLGMIPEYTLVDDDGAMIRRGWRSIMARLMLAKAATKHKLEKQFNVKLEYGEPDRCCPKCREDGLGVNINVRGSGLCGMHHDAIEASRKTNQAKKDHRGIVKEDLIRTQKQAVYSFI